MVNLSSFMGGMAGGATVSIVIKATDEFSSTMKSAQGSLTKLASVGKIALAGLAAGMAAFGSSAIKAAADYEVTQKSFEVMLGSVEKGQKMLKDLAEFTKQTPFQLPELETSARMLLGMGIEADKIIPTMKSLGDVAAGLGVDFDRLALNFGQVKSQGVLMGTELRDFARAGVPIIGELADMLGVAETEIKSMGSEGKITFDMVEEAFRRMTAEGGTFANLMKEQMGSARGQMSNLSDTILQIKRDMGEEMLPAFKEVVSAIADNKEAIIAFGKATATVFTGMINGIGWVIEKVQEMADLLAFNYKIAEAYAKLDFEKAGSLIAQKGQYKALRDEGLSTEESLRLSGRQDMSAEELVALQKQRIEAEAKTIDTIELSTEKMFDNIFALDAGTKAKEEEIKAITSMTSAANDFTIASSKSIASLSSISSMGGISKIGDYTLTGDAALAAHNKLYKNIKEKIADEEKRDKKYDELGGNPQELIEYEKKNRERMLGTYPNQEDYERLREYDNTNAAKASRRYGLSGSDIDELKSQNATFTEKGQVIINNNFYNQVNTESVMQDMGEKLAGAA